MIIIMEPHLTKKSWKMIRISAVTHSRLQKLHARREAARAHGQLAARNEHVTQDEVLTYLIEIEAALQNRRKRSRSRKMVRRSKSSNGIVPVQDVYTANELAE